MEDETRQTPETRLTNGPQGPKPHRRAHGNIPLRLQESNTPVLRDTHICERYVHCNN